VRPNVLVPIKAVIRKSLEATCTATYASWLLHEHDVPQMNGGMALWTFEPCSLLAQRPERNRSIVLGTSSGAETYVSMKRCQLAANAFM